MTKATAKTKKKAPTTATPSFVVSFSLLPNAQDERLLADRLFVAARLTNALIADAQFVLRTLRDSPEWAAARQMPANTPEANKARLMAFLAAKKHYKFERHAFEKRLGAHAKAAGFSKRIGSAERQKLAKRVFEAAEQTLVGKRGPLVFKGIRNPLCSVEGKSQTNMLKLVVNHEQATAALVMKNGWSIPVKLDAQRLKKDPWLADALRSRIKYCRLIKKTLKGETRWVVQAICEGVSPTKTKTTARVAKVPKATTAGLDLGVSILALVTDQGEVDLIQTSSPLAKRWDKEANQLGCRIDRQRRLNNPSLYQLDFKDSKGRPKKGKPLTLAKRKRFGLKGWEKSARQIKTEKRLAELRRLAADERQRYAREIANRIVSITKSVKDDGVSPKSLQKNYGRSARASVPGFLMDEIERKIKAKGGERTIIQSQVLKTSQYDHTTNDFQKNR